MQIKFNNVVLAGTWETETDELSRDVGENVQRSEFLEGSEPQWTSRGSHFSTVSFSSARSFPSIVEAELFFLEHGDTEGTNTATELVGIVEFYMDDGSRNATRYARGSLRIRINPPMGVSVVTNYTLEYGRILKTKPTD